MKHVASILLLLLAVAALAGCQSVGTNYEPSAVEKLVPNETTYAQAVEMLGSEPNQMLAISDGTRYEWRYASASPTGAKVRVLGLEFDGQGVYRRMLFRREI